jgi:hypothetical protein
MGLLQKILAQKMHLSWVEDEQKNRSIKPGWYLAVEFNYGSPPRKTRAEIKAETGAWLVEFATMFEDIPAQSRYLSGPLGFCALTGEYPWQETYTEMSIFAQKPVLQVHVSAARTCNYYLMRRISAKLRISSPVKYHFFHPATLEEALGPRRQPRRNLELTRIDAGANMICLDFLPRNHIRIRLHEDVKGQIVCTGDKQPVHYPPAYFNGIACSVGGKRMFVIDPRYTLLKETEAIKTGTTRHPERHQELIRGLESWMALRALGAGGGTRTHTAV